MTSLTHTSTPAGRAVPRRREHGYVVAGLVAAVAAAVVTTALAGIAMAAGVDFESADGEQIPVLAFPQLTLVASLLGLGLAAALRRMSRRPATTFVRTSVALTVASLAAPIAVPDVDAASIVVLVLLHLVAAAIVVPVVARRLAD